MDLGSSAIRLQGFVCEGPEVGSRLVYGNPIVCSTIRGLRNLPGPTLFAGESWIMLPALFWSLRFVGSQGRTVQSAEFIGQGDPAQVVVLC